jgi:outer membrane protein OmpA-like peptidoglycan-associated protein
MFRQASAVWATTIGERLLLGAGATYQINGTLSAMGELAGQIGFNNGKCRVVEGGYRICGNGSGASVETTPLELDVAGRTQVGYGVSLTGGAGIGLIRAIGTPAFRVFAGVAWYPDFNDADHDGIRDESDKCPNSPEDKDGFEDQDGCPDPDNDRDGVLDGYDSCPQTAEDRDGFKDDDGCPDPDNDRDGIPDKEDKCPNEKETVNGNQDDDGCPDEGEPKVKVEGDALLLAENIRFSSGGAEVHADSYDILEQLARTIKALKASKDIKGVRIVVNAKERGNVQRNLTRAQQQANAVREFLVKRSVEPTQVTAEGAIAQGRERNVEVRVTATAPETETKKTK